MALAGFSVRNYRSFVDTTSIEMRPLTMLFGYNSAGKSALLRASPLIAKSADPTLIGPLALDSEVARGATFGDIKTKLNDGFTLSFRLTWDGPPNEVRAAEFTVRDLQGGLGQVVEEVRTVDAEGADTLRLQWNTRRTDAGQPSYDVTVGETPADAIGLDFSGLLPGEAPAGTVDAVARLLAMLNQRLLDLRANTHWLTCVRTLSGRYFEAHTPRRRDVSATGSDAASYLADDKVRDGRVLARVSAWFEQVTSRRLSVLRDADRFRVVMSPLAGTQVEVDIRDTGEGMVQVLPVLVLVARAMESELGASPTIAIEHPELHLHPRAERDLAELFCRLAAQRSSRTLIETHSQNFLLQVQLALIEGRLSPEDVVVYWVHELADGRGVADRIAFDHLARPVGDAWPPEVFSEELDQARKIVIARRGKV